MYMVLLLQQQRLKLVTFYLLSLRECNLILITVQICGSNN